MTARARSRTFTGAVVSRDSAWELFATQLMFKSYFVLYNGCEVVPCFSSLRLSANHATRQMSHLFVGSALLIYSGLASGAVYEFRNDQTLASQGWSPRVRASSRWLHRSR